MGDLQYTVQKEEGDVLRDKMKVLMFSPNYYPYIGGAEVFAQEIAERLVRDGHEVDVITGLLDENLEKFEIINGVNIYRVRIYKGKYYVRYLSSLSYVFSSLLKALRLRKARRYDIIHAHAEVGGIAGVIFKKLVRRPLLVTVQGGAPSDMVLRNKIIRRVVGWCFVNSNAVHVISRYLKERAKLLGAKKIILIPDGVDDTKFHPMSKEDLKRKHGFYTDRRIILTVCPGHFRGKNPSSYDTGYPSLIKAFGELTKEIPDLQLVFIGEGHKRNEFKDIAAALHVEDRVTFLGFIPHDMLPDYFGMAEVFIRPSVGEGLGIAFIEAMACGVPVIGTNIGGIPDIIKHGENGLMVSPYNVEDIMNALRKILEDEIFRKKLIKEGLRTVYEKFRWSVVYREVRKIYTELVENSS